LLGEWPNVIELFARLLAELLFGRSGVDRGCV